jgi:hypothetical protein
MELHTKKSSFLGVKFHCPFRCLNITGMFRNLMYFMIGPF